MGSYSESRGRGEERRAEGAMGRELMDTTGRGRIRGGKKV